MKREETNGVTEQMNEIRKARLLGPEQSTEKGCPLRVPELVDDPKNHREWREGI